MDSPLLASSNRGDGTGSTQSYAMKHKPAEEMPNSHALLPRKRVLYIVPYCPWPAVHGGQVYVFYRLKELAKHHDFHIVCPAPPNHSSTSRAEAEDALSFCQSVQFWEPSTVPRSRILRLLTDYWSAIFSPLPRSAREACTRQARHAVKSAIQRTSPDIVQVEHFYTATSLPWFKHENTMKALLPVLATEQNVESCLLEDLAGFSDISRTRRWIARREAHHLQKLAHKLYPFFCGISFATDTDRSYYQKLGWTGRSSVCPPILPEASVIKISWEDSSRVAFFGSLGFFPNIEGLNWFCKDVWPHILESVPEARLVVPAKPNQYGTAVLKDTPSVDLLDIKSGPALDRLLIQCDLCISPIRLGSGIKMKNLMAMRLGMPTVATQASMIGIASKPEEDFLHAESAEEFATAVTRLLKDTALRKRLGTSAHTLFVRQYVAPAATQHWLDFLDLASKQDEAVAE